MKELPNTNFDKSEAVNGEIGKILKDLQIACNLNRVPMFVCVAAQNDEDGTDYKSYCLSAAQFGIRLTDDKISDFINIMNGFSTYYKAGGAGANEEYEKLVEVMQQGEAIARSKRGVVDED